MRNILLVALLMSAGGQLATAQSYYDDDIYYDPKKDKSSTAPKSDRSNYIPNMADMDVDTYNRRGHYYTSPIDTIGVRTETGEDFVYTQQIQKYYNPTIVVDNADVLADVLENSYGNVDIEINSNGIPVFVPAYPWSFSYGWGWPYYSGWSLSFYDPWFSYNWGWGPSWAWGPSWGWGGPGWGGYVRPGANWRSDGNRPVGPNGGWAGNTRPGSNYNGTRPGNHRLPQGVAARPGSSRPAGSSGVTNDGGHWEYKQNTTNHHRGQISVATGANPVSGSSTGRNPMLNTNGTTIYNSHRGSAAGAVAQPSRNSSVNRGGTTNGHRATNYNRTRTNANRNSYNTNRTNTNTNRNSYNSNRNSYNSNRGTGGYHRGGGGGHSTGGGRGRHR